MNLSGIVVVTRPEHLDSVVTALGSQPGVEVHYSDPDAGRIVVVQEAETIDDEIAGLKRIKQLPHVAMAEMASHYFGEDPQNYPPDRLDKLERQPVPAYLND